MFFDIVIVVCLLVIFLCLPNSNDTWKTGRMGCKLLVIKDRQLHCSYYGSASVCRHDDCPMMSCD